MIWRLSPKDPDRDVALGTLRIVVRQDGSAKVVERACLLFVGYCWWPLGEFGSEAEAEAFVKSELKRRSSLKSPAVSARDFAENT